MRLMLAFLIGESITAVLMACLCMGTWLGRHWGGR